MTFGLGPGSGATLRTHVRLAGPLLCACAMVPAACSRDAGPPDPSGEAHARAKYTFPPGVAAALSVTGAGGVANGNSLDTALDCNVALRVTSEVLAQRRASVGAGIMKAMDEAAKLYGDKAAAGARAAMPPVDAAAETAKRMDAAKDAPATQIQKAMACLRALGA